MSVPAVKLSPVYVKIEDRVIKDCTLELDKNRFRVSSSSEKDTVVDFVLSKLQVHGLTQDPEQGNRREEAIVTQLPGFISLYCQFDDHDGIIGIETSTRSDDDDFDGFVETVFAFEKHEDADTIFKCIAELLKDIDEVIPQDSSSEDEEMSFGAGDFEDAEEGEEQGPAAPLCITPSCGE